jgi:hypothetical protein
VAPISSPADCVQMYSADAGGVGGKASPHFRTEDGTIIVLNQTLLTTASPTFAGLTIGSLAGVLKGTAGVVGVIAFDAVSTHYLNGQGDWSIPSGTDPGGTIRISGSNVTISNDDEKSIPDTTYTCIKEIKINVNSPGVLTVWWDHQSGSVGQTIRTKLCKNGTIVGTEKTTTSITYGTVNQPVVTDLVANDLLQIWAKADDVGNTAYVRNMRLKYSWQITTIGAHILTTPLAVNDTTVISTTNQDP